ncbi:hypothetical protein KSX_79310 [Ktedonospora formicarum]|uniref:Uncharacterized protein n=1 Tax=Ktedonospora formicarum TaxID=2778364 RepID=A0A8J3MXI2_9CHLR|nr:hypothetical protein KSX_79310 [Ktedonospora formicarum]
MSDRSSAQEMLQAVLAPLDGPMRGACVLSPRELKYMRDLLTRDQQAELDKLIPLVKQARQSSDPGTEAEIFLIFEDLPMATRPQMAGIVLTTLATQGSL